MATNRRTAKTAWQEDPMVPIEPIRLRAAIDSKGWNNHAVAQRLGEKSQTLDNLTKGHTAKKTRRTRRHALAAVLDVSEGWLGGVEDLLADLRRVPRELTLSLSPRMQLAVTALLAKANRAYWRDLRVFGVGEDGVAISTKSGAITGMFDWYLLRLLRLDAWREQLTTWRQTERPLAAALFDAPGMLSDRRDLYTEEEDAVGVAMVAVLTATLRPWFDGKAQLDYNRLRVLVGYDRVGDDPNGMSHPIYLGVETSPLNLDPSHALGWPSWVTV